jgi:hypothetical protein
MDFTQEQQTFIANITRNLAELGTRNFNQGGANPGAAAGVRPPQHVRNISCPSYNASKDFERVTPLRSTMLGIPTATMASLYTPASIRTVPQQATTSLEDLEVKFKEQELNIAELKAAQALTNDRIGCMEKGVREDIQKLTNVITSGVRTQQRMGKHQTMKTKYPD